MWNVLVYLIVALCALLAPPTTTVHLASFSVTTTVGGDEKELDVSEYARQVHDGPIAIPVDVITHSDAGMDVSTVMLFEPMQADSIMGSADTYFFPVADSAQCDVRKGTKASRFYDEKRFASGDKNYTRHFCFVAQPPKDTARQKIFHRAVVEREPHVKLLVRSNVL